MSLDLQEAPAVPGPPPTATATSDGATLFINLSDSRCGACGKNADPHQTTHDTQLGWARPQPAGCGVRWTHVSSYYPDMDGFLYARIRSMRPDLIWIEP